MPFMQIVGEDGRLLSDEEGRLMLVVQGIEDGSMATPEMYNIGASLFDAVRTRSPASPAVSRFARLNPANLRGPAMNIFRPGPAMLQPAAPQGPTVQPVPAGALREVVQGLDSGAVLINAGASFTLTFNASMLFRPTRIMVGPSIAPLFVIEDFKVASDSLFLQTGPVPAEAFLPNAVGASALKRRTAQPGTPLTFIVTNIDGAPHRFRGCIFGEASDASNC